MCDSVTPFKTLLCEGQKKIYKNQGAIKDKFSNIKIKKNAWFV